jgi:hypothetical protein
MYSNTVRPSYMMSGVPVACWVYWKSSNDKPIVLSRFSTSEFSRAKPPFTFVGITYYISKTVAKWMPTKEKGRFARKNSLVENQL